jgi:hypothetical protein
VTRLRILVAGLAVTVLSLTGTSAAQAHDPHTAYVTQIFNLDEGNTVLYRFTFEDVTLYDRLQPGEYSSQYRNAISMTMTKCFRYDMLIKEFASGGALETSYRTTQRGTPWGYYTWTLPTNAHVAVSNISRYC